MVLYTGIHGGRFQTDRLSMIKIKDETMLSYIRSGVLKPVLEHS